MPLRPRGRVKCLSLAGPCKPDMRSMLHPRFSRAFLVASAPKPQLGQPSPVAPQTAQLATDRRSRTKDVQSLHYARHARVSSLQRPTADQLVELANQASQQPNNQTKPPTQPMMLGGGLLQVWICSGVALKTCKCAQSWCWQTASYLCFFACIILCLLQSVFFACCRLLRFSFCFMCCSQLGSPSARISTRFHQQSDPANKYREELPA